MADPDRDEAQTSRLNWGDRAWKHELMPHAGAAGLPATLTTTQWTTAERSLGWNIPAGNRGLPRMLKSPVSTKSGVDRAGSGDGVSHHSVRCPDRGVPEMGGEPATRYGASVRRGIPAGTVTFLFTHIADSTRRWEEDPTAMAEALAFTTPSCGARSNATAATCSTPAATGCVLRSRLRPTRPPRRSSPRNSLRDDGDMRRPRSAWPCTPPRRPNATGAIPAMR